MIFLLLKNRYFTTTLLLLLGLVFLSKSRQISTTEEEVSLRAGEVSQLSLQPFYQLESFMKSFRQLTHVNQILEENRQLVMENQILSADIEAAQRRTNEFERTLVALKQPPWLEQSQLGQITGKDFSNLSQVWRISVGEEEGAFIDAPVIGIYQGQVGLAGKIIETSKKSSLMLPLTARNFYVSGTLSKSQLTGLTEGKGENSSLINLLYISKDFEEELALGDELVSSGVSEIYPSGIPIGQIHQFEKDPFSATLDIEIRSYIDLNKIRYVYVLKKREIDLPLFPTEEEEKEGEERDKRE